ncbi:hypothetical protein PC119_g23764 [Phytophthora cactorum]|uniref:Uncharacterized protein n=1 Tax=Phytophthora cactorum TaxID=29920 RepID=A0A8T0YA44_9STRA|nr:hypothetical protein PC113_g17878 [Phytophthora cactorum]KAG2891845.1 hypothetical protein PC117_g24165 [Phytophthora cactorum]KAG2969971.1 hypothetical protein PC119_g23764 [Phytophthora cactorum]
MRARCRVSGEDYEIVTTPITESFHDELLDTFCELRLNIASADGTEGMLIAEIEHITGSVKNQTLPDIKALFQSKLRLNMTESDVYARVLDYFNEFGKVMRANYLLSTAVATTVAFTFAHKPAASDPRLLFDLIVDNATEHERQCQRLKTKKKEAPEEKKEKSKAKSEQLTKTKKPWGSNPSSAPSSGNKCTTETRKSTFVSGTKLPPSTCPKCKEMHWIKDCPKATEIEKDELRKKLRDANLAKCARLKRLDECLPVPSRTVALNGALQLPYCLDTGSDYTLICRSHGKKDPSVEAEELDTPVRNQTFGSNWVAADMKAKLHLLIHTAAGPVEPMSTVAVLIVGIDYGEFIVGNDLQNTLGIDVDRQLESWPTVETVRLVEIRSSWKTMTCRPPQCY